MSGKKSKDKGKGYEREVAKFLSEKYSESFIRTSASGAYIGGMNSSRKANLAAHQIANMKGDIVTPEGWHNVSLECKFYKDFPFNLLFEEKVAMLDEWIKQVNDAADGNDLRIIFMKFNRKKEWICYHSDAKKFVVEPCVNYKGWVFCSAEKFWTDDNSRYFKDYCLKGV